jgi:hypothetical protein
VTHIRKAWKAVVAFFAPGLLLLAERVLLADGNVDSTLLSRALIVGAATSVTVWATRNGRSPDGTTSTPDTGHNDVGGILGVLLIVVFVLVVLSLAGVL